MYGYICRYCGDHLDTGEQCNCRKEKEEKTDKMLKFYISDSDGQMTIKEAIA